MKSQTFPPIDYADWRRQVETQLGELGFEEAMVHRADGVDFEALCTACHPERSPAAMIPGGWGTATSSPGELNWFPCQEFGEPDPEKLNHHLKSDLANGVHGIWLRLDRAARQGDDPMSSGSVCIGGAALYRLADLAAAFDGASVSWRSILLDAGANFLPAAAMLVGWMQSAGLETEKRALLLGADPLGTLARDGELPTSLDQLSDDMATLVRQSQENWPASRALAITSQPYREAGAEIDQELAICLSTGAEYLRWMEKRGVEPETTAAELTLVTSIGQQIFLEIAKLRALRALWDQMVGACEVKSTPQPWIHAAVLRRGLPSRDPSFNLLRVTTAGWAAIMGGADSLETPPYDWYNKTPETSRGSRLARNTQSILGLEAELGRVADPGGGSYFLETVTQELISRSWALFQEIESQGGLLESLSSGWLQNAIADRWDERRKELENGGIPLTGINCHVNPDRTFHPTSDAETRRVQELIRQRFARQERGLDPDPISIPEASQNRWQWCLDSAAENRSLGEMRAVLYGGEAGPSVRPLKPHLDSEPYEEESVES